MNFTLRIFIYGLAALVQQDSGYTVFLLDHEVINPHHQHQICTHYPYFVVAGEECLQGLGDCPTKVVDNSVNPGHLKTVKFLDCPGQGCWRLESAHVSFTEPSTQDARIRREGGREWCRLWGGGWSVGVPCRGFAANDADWALQLGQLQLGGAKSSAQIAELAVATMDLPSGALRAAKLMSIPSSEVIPAVKLQRTPTDRILHEQAIAEVLVLETRVSKESVVLQLENGGSLQRVTVTPRAMGGDRLVELYIFNEASYEECRSSHGDHASAYGHLLEHPTNLHLEPSCDLRRPFRPNATGETRPVLLSGFPTFEDWPEETELEKLLRFWEGILSAYCREKSCRDEIAKEFCELRVGFVNKCLMMGEVEYNDFKLFDNTQALRLLRDLKMGEIAPFLLNKLCMHVVGGGNGGKPICPVAEVQ